MAREGASFAAAPVAVCSVAVQQFAAQQCRQREAMLAQTAASDAARMSDAEHLRLHCNTCVQPQTSCNANIDSSQILVRLTSVVYPSSENPSAAAAIVARSAGASRLVRLKGLGAAQ